MNLSLIFAKIIQIPFIFLQGDALGPQLGDKFGELTESIESTGTGNEAISEVVNKFISFAIPLGVVAAVGLLTYAGYIMMASQGNPEKLKEAKDIVTNAITGFAIIALSVVILIIINNVFNLGVEF
ncbi:MAG TPA: hypothetical protein PKJ86_00575 [Candidatus Dojkabacteria bacterium]|nr:hypothetical protein [Candidatus Dojkabacteria bacterium]